jgi:hypothetical protein
MLGSVTIHQLTAGYCSWRGKGGGRMGSLSKKFCLRLEDIRFYLNHSNANIFLIRATDLKPLLVSKYFFLCPQFKETAVATQNKFLPQ